MRSPTPTTLGAFVRNDSDWFASHFINFERGTNQILRLTPRALERSLRQFKRLVSHLGIWFHFQSQSWQTYFIGLMRALKVEFRRVVLVVALVVKNVSIMHNSTISRASTVL